MYNEFSILIVEDDADLAISMQEILLGEGYGAEVAADARSAVALCARQSPFDLAIIDLKLPDMPGIELIGKLGQVCPEMEFIINTGYASLETAMAAVARQRVIGYETKPVDPQHLLTLVSQVAERKAAEAALAESESRFRALVESSADHIFMLDTNGRYLFSNARTEQFGLEGGASLVGLTLEDVYPPDIARFYRSQVELVLKTGQPVVFEHSLPRGNVQQYHLDTLYPIWKAGTIWAVGGICHDVTALQRAQEQLEHRLKLEEMIAAIAARFIGPVELDEAIDLSLRDVGELTGADRAYVFQLHDAGSTIDNTHEWCRSGVSPQIENLQDVPCATFPWWIEKMQAGETIHVADVSGMPPEAAAEQELVAGQDIRSFILLPLNVAGEWAGFVGLDNVSETGEWGEDAALILGMTRDIIAGALERQRSRQALRESEAKYATLVEQAGDGVVIAQDGVLRFANRALAAMAGYTVEELRDRPFADLMVPGDHDWALTKHAQRMSGEALDGTYDLRMVRKDGTLAEVEVSVASVEYQNRPAAMAVVRDVTEKRRAEQLARETEMLRQIDGLRKQLLANVSHELKTPLTVIQGYATMLRRLDGSLESEQRLEHLEAIERSAADLGELIENLLDITRLESGMLAMEKAPTRIPDLLREAALETQVRFPHRVVTWDLPSDLPEMRIDARRTRQVLHNLIDNAVKYSPEGTQVFVTARRDNDQIVFAVRDEGPGIPPGDAERVFESMYRIERPSGPRVAGAGLGLAVCKGIVEAHGGRIWIESEEGRGTTCSFAYPVDSAPDNRHQETDGNG